MFVDYMICFQIVRAKEKYNKTSYMQNCCVLKRNEEVMIKDRYEIKIDRQHVCETFDAYVKNYDIKDEKIRLKAEHTYRVSELCERIAKSLALDEEDVDLAWLLGMLHDIGRFEQVKRYGTFMDSQSVNHAEFGAKLLFEEGLLEKFIDLQWIDIRTLYDLNEYMVVESVQNEETAARVLYMEKIKGYTKLIYQAIFWHSAYRLPEDIDERTKMFCDILRDADKVDILRVNVEFSFEDIYNVPLEVLRKCEVADEVMRAVYEKHAVFRDLRKSPIDYLVGHICLVYEMVYPETVRIVVNQGYLDKLLNFQSENEKTQGQFREIRKKMEEYIKYKEGVK